MTDPNWTSLLREAELRPAVDPGGLVVVLSAHPDDEVLALGAWLSLQADRPLRFVIATDGEASHPGSPTISPDELQRRRPAELLDALTRLGLTDVDVRRLHLTDAGLPRDRHRLVEALAPSIADAALVVAPYRHDGHADHDVLGDVAAQLCGDETPLWEYPVWHWQWTSPDPGAPLLARARALPRTSAGRHHKLEALAAFTTQVNTLSPDPADRAVVDAAMIRHALDAPEVVLT